MKFSLLIDFLLIAVIFLTKRLRMDPDNLATPLAASIGDIVSLLLLSHIASLIYSIHGKNVTNDYYFLIYIQTIFF